MPVKEIIAESESRMKKAVEVLHDELKTVRTGQASTGLVENIKVEYYGTTTPLKGLAALSVTGADMIVIKPFDPSSVREIEKAIKNSELSIAPIVEGKLIRLKIPPLTEERRKQLVGQARQLGEQAKVSIRNARRDANKKLEDEKEGKVITEDDMEKSKKHIDDITKDYTGKIDTAIKSKSDEVMLE
jgi:ribosome recycling factor